MLTAKINELVEKHYPHVRDVRHWLHRNAEISWKEYKTSARIVEELERLGIPYEAHYGNDTNVAAWIKGTGSGTEKTILLRADMDALPIEEDEGHEPRSENPGVMHACGHDGHTAGMLGVAAILNELKDQFSGTVKIAFEAAEENGGGSHDFIREGFLDDVEGVFGCHLGGSVKEGSISTRVGNFMSASNAIHITIRGLSGHSSTPHLAIDPVSIAAQMITTAQAVVSRLVAPTEIAVLGFSTINGGTVFNTIPDEVKITGSLRCFTEETREKIQTSLAAILKGICEAYGASCELSFTNQMYAVVNDEKLAKCAVESLQKSLGEEHVELLRDPLMASESFADYRQKAPIFFYYVGIDAGDALPVGHTLFHNGSFCWHDEVLKVSMKTMAQIALDYMRK